MPVALPALFAIAGLIFAIGLLTMSDAFIRALFGGVAKGLAILPWVGKSASNGVLVIGKRISNVLGEAILHLQGTVSDTWHVLATLIEQTGQAIWEATELGARALYAYEVLLPIRLAKLLADAGQAAGHKARAAIQPTVTNIYKSTGITRAQYRALLRKVTTLGLVVAAIRAAQAHAPSIPRVYVPSLPATVKGIRGRLGRLERLAKPAAFAALVAAALARLGAGWIRCTNTRRAGKALCGLDPDLLEALLGGVLLVSGGMSIRAFALGMEQIGDEAVGAITGFVREA